MIVKDLLLIFYLNLRYRRYRRRDFGSKHIIADPLRGIGCTDWVRHIDTGSGQRHIKAIAHTLSPLNMK